MRCSCAEALVWRGTGYVWLLMLEQCFSMAMVRRWSCHYTVWRRGLLGAKSGGVRVFGDAWRIGGSTWNLLRATESGGSQHSAGCKQSGRSAGKIRVSLFFFKQKPAYEL